MRPVGFSLATPQAGAREPRVPSLRSAFHAQAKLIDHGGRLSVGFLLVLSALLLLDPINLWDGVDRFPNLVPVLFAAVAWPFIIWQGEPPSRRRYHWTLPVDTVTHDLVRVAVGAIALCAFCAASLLIMVGLLAIGEGWSPLAYMSPLAWLNFITGPLVVYLLVSPIALIANRPLVGLLLAGGGIVGYSAVIGATRGSGLAEALDAIVTGALGLRMALAGAWDLQPWELWDELRPVHGYMEYDAPAFVAGTLLWIAIAGCLTVVAAQFAARRA